MIRTTNKPSDAAMALAEKIVQQYFNDYIEEDIAEDAMLIDQAISESTGSLAAERDALKVLLDKTEKERDEYAAGWERANHAIAESIREVRSSIQTEKGNG